MYELSFGGGLSSAIYASPSPASEESPHSSPTEEPGPMRDPFLDYEDDCFEEEFSSLGVVFKTVEDVLVAINEY
ncbi:hypothetical protein IV203_016015 [Nitzschia inconspicua]|uniref:Uncharacterized protein n=1 Tax=Nitzschia inconspicua TaxID=303405 RepID=A0A9K3KQH4_9STRA|nr:hypothetical protein IV203_016015 [Nitzschia inconspicua]